MTQQKPAQTGTWGWLVASGTFVGVLVAQLLLVAFCGTDIPFHDQWNIEGHWLYPAWLDGSLQAKDLFKAFNEHRIFWTHLLNLALFSVNGQWDPLVQLVAIAVLRASCAAGLIMAIGGSLSPRGRFVLAVSVTLAFFPLLSWHNILWGIESHAYFAFGFSLISLCLLGESRGSFRRVVFGCLAGVAGLFAMGPSALVAVALLGLAALRSLELRRMRWTEFAPAAVLLVIAWLLHTEVPAHAPLEAHGVGEFMAAASRLLGWPHVQAPLAAIAMNAPILLLVSLRLARLRTAADSEDRVLVFAGWSMAIMLATAWTRGGSVEFEAGIPSRYVDFIMLLPLANLWAVVTLAREAGPTYRKIAGVVATAWVAFLCVGWLGLSAEVVRGIVLPRSRDREAPVRLMREFQVTGDAAVYEGQPRLLVPAPDLEVVRRVLQDPRMNGVLPPSMQPDQPLGPLSRATRFIVGR